MEWKRRDTGSTPLAKNGEQSVTSLSCATEIRAIPEPTQTMSMNQQGQRLETDDIEEQFILKDVKTSDNVFVIYDPKEHDLHWNSPQGIVVDPCLFWNFSFDHKLDCDFRSMTTV